VDEGEMSRASGTTTAAPVIEWNAHLFSSDTGRYPFHPRAAYTPGAARLSADPLADYLRRLDAEGIDRAVVVHPEPYGDDHRLVLDCLRREPDRLRGTCLFYPDDPQAVAKLRALVRQEPRVVALRFHAHRGKEQYLDTFADEGVRGQWAAAADLGLIVELHIGPNYAAQAEARIQEFPRVPVLIDHLAEPALGTPVEYADVLALARYRNVYMKLSGLNHFAADAPHYESARRFTRLVVDTFGPGQLVWGSGAPGIVDAHLAHWPAGDRAAVKGGNLARLLRWP
jgi:predicted TIM-barrel fold metal-dependent hydrolase